MDSRAGGWTGFTDEDLQKLKKSTADGGGSKSNVRRGGQSKRGGVRLGAETQQARPPEPLAASQRLAQPVVSRPETSARLTVDVSADHSANRKLSEKSDNSLKNTANDDVKKLTESPGVNSLIDLSAAVEAVAELEDKLVLDDKKILSLEMGNMGKFRDQQKMMEELNKKKKALLSTAIQERQKKAKVEAVKLTRIKQELDRMDQMVVSDVAIIRDKIEDASREFTDAQKRYIRAEKEFIESKIDLHRKQEVKDQLTEHLYTVIHQNELRKAKKLGELMDKLEMEDDGALDALPEGAALPPLNVVCVTSPVERKKGCLQSLALLSPPASSETSDPIPDTTLSTGEAVNSLVNVQPMAVESTIASESTVEQMTELSTTVMQPDLSISNSVNHSDIILLPSTTGESLNNVRQDPTVLSNA